MVRFSKNQKEAVRSFGRPVRVFAGAGSGKTTVLVERFFYAATALGMDPERILAITFTDKAANEMKKRLLQKCAESGNAALRRQIENAAISTIHSFCAKILKENPIEAGVDPYFRILGEGEAEILAHQVLDGVFEAEAGNDVWIRFLGDHDEESVRGAFEAIYETYRALGGDESIFAVKDFSDQAKARVSAISEDIRSVSLSDPVIAERFGDLPGLLKNPSVDWKTLGEVLAVIKSVEKRGRHREAIARIHEAAASWRRFQVQKLSEIPKREFLKIFSRFKEAYEAEKRKRAAYDFEDLLFAVHRLFTDSAPAKKEVLERLRKHYTCILVDECQDTSPVQAGIIRNLSEGSRSFVVGDPRQSIYGFRHADPEIFQAFSKNKTLKPRDLSLSDNYRSRAEILDWVNGLSGRLFSPIPGPLLRAAKKFHLEKDFCVEWLYAPADKDTEYSVDELRIAEAKALAARVRQLVDSKFLVEEGGLRRPIEYRDIAVLLRTTTASSFYEKEFSELSVPYFALKSRGFYEKPEVKDIVHFLVILENPNADIALAGVLRSPLVGLTEDGLFWTARHVKSRDRRRPLAEALEAVESIGGLSDRDRERLSRFQRFWSELRGRKNRYRISEIIEKILDETLYEAKTLALPEGRQKVANVRKLWEMAEHLEAQGMFGIVDFVNYLRALSERETLAPEARIQAEQANAVTISTVHAAKGLEFPCVVIADMGSVPKNNPRGGFLCRQDFGFGLKVRNPLTHALEPDATYFEINRVREEKDGEEDRRLLYVAMTRAKEHLILSGVFSLRSSASWMGRVAEAIGLREFPVDGTVFGFGKVSVRVTRAGESQGRVPALPAAKEKTRFDRKFFAALEQRVHFSERAYEQIQDLTVTDLLRKSLQGLEPEPTLPVEDNGEETTPRNEYGTLFHRAMEFLVKANPRVVSESWIGEFSKGLTASEREEMLQSVRRFWEGAWGKTVREATLRYAELPFIYKTPYGILKGQMDLVFKTRKGEWVVLDFKTNRITAFDKERAADLYRLQLELYALVFKELYGEAPKKGVLYFSALHDAVTVEFGAADYGIFKKQLELYYARALETLKVS
jgi:ATP-dependent helicase/nuclease subunit A